jgi:hypothetical protein
VSIGIAILTAKKQPYIWGFNNILEVILYALNGLFVTIPILGYFGILLPDSSAEPMSYVLIFLPFLALIPIICVRNKVFEDDDPTTLEKLTKEEEQRREGVIKRRKDKRQKERRLNKSSDDDGKDAEQGEEEMLFADITVHRIDQFKEDMVQIEPAVLDSIEATRLLARKKILGHTDLRTPMWIDKRVLAKRAALMYEMIDHVIDGVTFENLHTVLTVAVLGAGVAFGWFIGVLLAHQTSATGMIDVLCA